MDYDVEVLGLTSPAASAPKTTYRPAVSVRNNGIHDALASGVLRIYAAGQLVFTTEIYTGTLTPGQTGPASAVDYWTPDAEGAYMFIADVTSPLDQDPTNNHLSPTAVVITGEQPPEPPTVPYHAAQHEEGGPDELSVDGLPGLLADRQEPRPHGPNHQAGASDEINVGSLRGVLADQQVPTAHGNTYHSPIMATAQELALHNAANSAHSAAENLANREVSGPETGLVKGIQLAPTSEFPRAGFSEDSSALRMNRTWGNTNPVIHAFSHEIDADDPVIPPHLIYPINGGPLSMLGVPNDLTYLLLDVPWTGNQMIAILESCGDIALTPNAGQSLSFILSYGGAILASTSIPLAGGYNGLWSCRAVARATDGTHFKPWASLTLESTGTATSSTHHALTNLDTLYVSPAVTLKLQIAVVNAGMGSVMNSFLGLAYMAGSPTP